MIAFEPRPNQKKVLEYTSGRMGVSAVPGSGKTATLSYLAANLIANNHLDNHQEVLIVTLANSAVDNFSRRISEYIKQRGLLARVGYRVRTLHSLANDIIRERPALVGLSEGFTIIDEREANDIVRDAAIAWVRAHPYIGEEYLNPDFDENKADWAMKEKWPIEVAAIAGNFIKQAKDLQQDPEQIRRNLDRFGQPLDLAEMCLEIYINYQRGLNYRGAVDFQDLIRLALRVLEQDDLYLQRLQHRWPYILEDEAQDSSKLQQDILKKLTGEKGNWVRVGDPNQAIYETFTTAKPEYLREFMREDGVIARTLPNSGRSTKSIIDLANYLIEWTKTKHPVEAVKNSVPLDEPYIELTPKGDPQPNPSDTLSEIHLRGEDYSSDDEVSSIARSLQRWLPDNQDKTVAVLVPRNDKGAQVVKALKQYDIDVVELLTSTSTTRETAGALVFILEALANPHVPSSLAMAYKVWRRDDRDDAATADRLDQVVKALRKCKQVEDYLYPQSDFDWLDSQVVTELTQDDDAIFEQLVEFRAIMQRWQAAIVLPIDQLLLILAQDLFITATDLAIAHSLAVYLRRLGDVNVHWRLPDFAIELRAVAQNKRRVPDLSEEGLGYNPEDYKGKVTIATMHKAKGLEWDRVYMMAVNTYNFPSAEPYDEFIGEKWFVRDNLNLQAEALEQLDRLSDTIPFPYEEGKASQAARIEYASERLRLLYVGITRAKKELIMTWNHGRPNNKAAQAIPFVALSTFWEGKSK